MITKFDKSLLIWDLQKLLPEVPPEMEHHYYRFQAPDGRWVFARQKFGTKCRGIKRFVLWGQLEDERWYVIGIYSTALMVENMELNIERKGDKSVFREVRRARVFTISPSEYSDGMISKNKHPNTKYTHTKKNALRCKRYRDNKRLSQEP